MMVLQNPFIPATSYANAGGTGNRTATLTAAAVAIATTAGTVSNLVDGATAANSTDAWDPADADPGLVYFDFNGYGVKKYIDEIRLKWNGTPSNGSSWVVSGSNDFFSSFDVLASSFTWDQATQTVVLSGVSEAGYRYYGISSGEFGSGWFLEVEFKIADGAT